MLVAHTPNMISPFLLPLLLLSLSLFICTFSGTTTLLQGQSLTDDGQTLISPAKIFELGFFSPQGSSGRRYLGIYYHNIPTQSIVWIANRDNPLLDSSGILSLGANGNLSLLDRAAGNSLWSTDTSTTSNNSLSLMLLDSGRLVLQLANETIIWDSFDHPSDTFLPGMKLLFNKKTESRILFRSWRSADDPSTGNYSLGLDSSGQIFIWEGDSRPRWRSGQWDGTKFIGTTMRPLYLYGFHLTNDVDNGLIYFTYTEFNGSLIRFVLQWDGVENTSMLVMKTKQWESVWVQPVNDCEIYGKCGEFSICSQSSTPICTCLKGFEPKNGDEWGNGNWSGGCVRRTELGCEMNGSRDGEDGFFKVEGVKVPDLSDWASTVRNNEDCESYCQSNCSCKAYAYILGIGCFTWDRRIIDVYEFAEGDNINGNDLYIKLAASELGNKCKIWRIIAIVCALAIFFAVAFAVILCKYHVMLRDWWKKHRMREVSFDGLASKRAGITESSGLSGSVDEGLEANGIELPLYSFDSIATATNNFNNSNKLGEGGFGHVYKGVLPDGKDIAVKRLSRSSGQGQQEFKNEMTLIAKLQHRNLVRLLVPDKQGLLGWSKRFEIIEGVARGLVYLHQDSRLRIIHRDLKASNILLDESMNPKISDFGMARIFGNDQNHDNTERVVGTFGYMAPEYGMEGLFSVKSDVYSFGILVLEIVSGRRNNSFHRMGNSIINIVGYAWQLWNEDRAMELIDSSILETCSTRQVMRCIHVGLLCVQDRANDRPDMPSVLLMLGIAVELPLVMNVSSKPVAFALDGPVFLDVGGNVCESRLDNVVSCVAKDLELALGPIDTLIGNDGDLRWKLLVHWLLSYS
ncbi:G-type lectin S-receptor-like serine/threonine-protein kinase B120 [Dendrobium catenatum]|uniref:Receptor-like serine/threonine-protein kinase n=1 Tax=Dendrobium catenatum TaxID=906689 RepID=A0A2I0XCU2_9ASPA|nr:G-type lectin S-receptor-like serine/threonine-protein kinase B120 [Dendrobium catenatum]